MFYQGSIICKKILCIKIFAYHFNIRTIKPQTVLGTHKLELGKNHTNTNLSCSYSNTFLSYPQKFLLVLTLHANSKQRNELRNFLQPSCVHTISTAKLLHELLFIFFFRVIGRFSPVTFGLYSLN